MKRASGGKRAGDKRRAQAAAKQDAHAAWNRADLRAFAALAKREPDAAGAYLEALEALRLVVRRAARNPALLPQQRHEMVGRHAAALVKAADPGRLIQQLGEELREAHADNDALRLKLDAATHASRNQGQPQGEAVN